MKTLLRRSALVCFLLVATLGLAGTTAAQAPADPAGRWDGAIALPAGELGIQVDLAGDGGAWTGSIDIPAQNLADFALSDVTVDGRSVGFAMAGVPGTPTFAGELSADGDRIAGTFTQGGAELTFSLSRTAEGGDGGDTAPDAAPAPVAPPAVDDPPPVPGEGPVGHWFGRLDVGPAVLRLALEVEEGEDGVLTAVLDSIDQGTKIDVGTAIFADGELTLSIPQIGGSYAGSLNADGSAFAGTWTQGGRSLPLTFERRAEGFALNRPQEPKPPFPYSAREVTFDGGDAGVRLAGTLLVPEGEGPFPAVVFASGSGAQDRDEQLTGHKPFLVVADHLARHGIASLRYDDRGFAASTGDHLGSTVDDFADDLAAALAFLRGQEEVRDGAVGVVGHSEGGLSAAKVAAADEGRESATADFLVLLAAPAEQLPALLQRQTRAVLLSQGVDAELIDRAMVSQGEDLELIRDRSLSAEDLRTKLRERGETQLTALSEAEREALGASDATMEQGIRTTTTTWFRSLMREDPAVHLAKVEVPVLALFGGRDLQVDPEVNAERMRAALAAAPTDDHEVEVLPGLNHLFQHSETGRVDEYGSIEETFAPQALEKVSTWILAHGSPAGDARPAE